MSPRAAAKKIVAFLWSTYIFWSKVLDKDISR